MPLEKSDSPIHRESLGARISHCFCVVWFVCLVLIYHMTRDNLEEPRDIG